MKKNLKTVKGSACFDFENNEFSFSPYKSGEAVQKNVRTRRQSKIYETEGKKSSSLVAHLVAQKNSPDPIADMIDDFSYLAKENGRKIPEIPVGRVLLETPNIKVVADSDQRLVMAVITIEYADAVKPEPIVTNASFKLSTCLQEFKKLFK